MKNSAMRTVMKIVAKVAYKSAEKNANSACLWWQHQPKPPKNINKLRKF